MGRKTSIVWNHFTIPALFPKKALCNYCGQLVCRGQSNLGTTSLMNHLKRCNEFKANILGMPKGVNDVMAAVASAAEAPMTHYTPFEECSENGDAMSNDEEHLDSHLSDHPEFMWHDVSVHPHKSSAMIPMNDDAPSFVRRTVGHSNRRFESPSMIQLESGEYQSEDRSSVLLYGDISSTSEHNEEPSSSTVDDALPRTSFSEETKSYSSKLRVDLEYSGSVLQQLYQQYQDGKYCDMSIIPQKTPSNEVMISETGKVTRKSLNTSKEDNVINVHSCVLGAVSTKVNSFVEMGCSTIHLKKGGKDSVKGLFEIVYTGKLDRIRTYTDNKLCEILEVARFLEVDSVVKYLTHEILEGKPVNGKTGTDKFIQNIGQTLKTTQTTFGSPIENAKSTVREERYIPGSSGGLLCARKRTKPDCSSRKNDRQHSMLEKSGWLLTGRSTDSRHHKLSTLQKSHSRARKKAVHEIAVDRDARSDDDMSEAYRPCRKRPAKNVCLSPPHSTLSRKSIPLKKALSPDREQNKEFVPEMLIRSETVNPSNRTELPGVLQSSRHSKNSKETSPESTESNWIINPTVDDQTSSHKETSGAASDSIYNTEEAIPKEMTQNLFIKQE